MDMLLKIISKNYVLYAMTGIFLAGVLSRFFLCTVYRRLQRDIYRLPASKSHIIKLIKLRYESSSMLDMQISNTEAFVKKNLYGYRVCGISLRAAEKFLGQAMFFCALLGASTSILGLLMEMDSIISIVHIMAAALFSLLLYNYDRISDIDYKRQVAETGIIDFLENHLQSAILSQSKDEELKQECKIIDFTGNGKKTGQEADYEQDGKGGDEESVVMGNEESVLEMNDVEAEENKKMSDINNNRIIEEVLKEFFG